MTSPPLPSSMREVIVCCNPVTEDQPMPSARESCAECGIAVWLAHTTRDAAERTRAQSAVESTIMIMCVEHGLRRLGRVGHVVVSQAQLDECAALGRTHASATAAAAGVPVTRIDDLEDR